MRKKLLSALLALVMLVTAFSGLSLTADATQIVTDPTGYTNASQVVYKTTGSYIANWGARGEACKFLSNKAQQYYTGSYTYETLSALSGGTSQSNAPSSALYSALKSMMNAKSTSTTSYNGTKELYKYTDCLKNDTTKISSFYSGALFDSDWDPSVWNREHTWPNSKGLNGNDENDIMMLRPTIISENSSRGNTAYGESSGYFDPGESVRGDCARIVLYVYTRWGNTGNMWGTSGVMENMNVLLKWMEEDPVDTWEMGRNDAVQSITGVRNAFVDYPEYAWLLFGQSVPSGYCTPSNSGSTVSYQVTATSNNPDYGTVSVNGYVITASPAAGYYAKGYEITSGSATVSQNGNVFTVSPASDCEITILFAKKEMVTVSFTVPDGVTMASQVGYAGEFITLGAPTGTPTDTTHKYTFAGWAADAVADTVTRPTLLTAGSKYTLQADTTLYAVYSYSEEGSVSGTGDYVKLTAAPSDWSGEYLIGYAGTSTIMDGSLAKLDAANNTQTVTVTNNTVAAAAGDPYRFTVRAVSGGYSIQSASGVYMGMGTADNGIAESNTEAYVNTLEFTDGYAEIIGSAGAHLRFNNSSSQMRFRYYKPTSFANQQPICLYRKDGGSAVTHYLTLEGATPRPCDHAWGEGVVTTQPTCTQAGVKTYTCSKCNETKTEEIAPLGHIDENTDGKCDRCGEEISVCSHDWDAGVVTTAATYSAPGVMTYTCAKCGETKTAEIPALALPFVDVKDTDYFRAPVAWALDNAITYGDDETHFAPQSPCTREQVVTFLWRASGKPAPKSETCPFVDVKPTDYSYDAVRWAAEQGITMGTDETHFSPKATVTRAQFVSFLWRADGKPEAGTENTFTDLDENEYYVPAVLWAVEKQITVGTGNGKFSPDAPCLREQVVTFLYRDR